VWISTNFAFKVVMPAPRRQCYLGKQRFFSCSPFCPRADRVKNALTGRAAKAKSADTAIGPDNRLLYRETWQIAIWIAMTMPWWTQTATSVGTEIFMYAVVWSITETNSVEIIPSWRVIARAR
jgi:hypothetical protein